MAPFSATRRSRTLVLSLALLAAAALGWSGLNGSFLAGKAIGAGDGCFSLKLSVAAGKGTVQATPVSEGGCLEHQYPKDFKVSLLATPADGYTFDGWKGSIDGKDNPGSVTMKKDEEVAAYFAAVNQGPKCYTLTLSVGSGNGIVSATPLSGGDCPEHQYPKDFKVSVLATPASGSGFLGWKGVDDEKSNPVSVVMKGDRTVTGYFSACLRLFISTGGHGTVQVSPTSAGGCASGRYPAGTSVKLTAKANDGFKFTGWSGTDNNKSNPTKVVMNDTRHVTALFVSTEPTATATKPHDPEKTATPTKPSDHVKSPTPTKPPEHENTPTPTKPSDHVKSPTPTKDPETHEPTATKPPEQEKTATPTKPSEPEKSPTPTKGPDAGEPTATPTKPAEPEKSPTPTKQSEPEKTPTPTKQSEPEASPTPTKVVEVRGDATCDGVANALDALVVLQLDAGIVHDLPCRGGADVNHDGRVNTVDAAIMLQAAAGLFTAL